MTDYDDPYVRHAEQKARFQSCVEEFHKKYGEHLRAVEKLDGWILELQHEIIKEVDKMDRPDFADNLVREKACRIETIKGIRNVLKPSGGEQCQ